MWTGSKIKILFVRCDWQPAKKITWWHLFGLLQSHNAPTSPLWANSSIPWTFCTIPPNTPHSVWDRDMGVWVKSLSNALLLSLPCYMLQLTCVITWHIQPMAMQLSFQNCAVMGKTFCFNQLERLPSVVKLPPVFPMRLVAEFQLIYLMVWPWWQSYNITQTKLSYDAYLLRPPKMKYRTRKQLQEAAKWGKHRTGLGIDITIKLGSTTHGRCPHGANSDGRIFYLLHGVIWSYLFNVFSHRPRPHSRDLSQ